MHTHVLAHDALSCILQYPAHDFVTLFPSWSRAVAAEVPEAAEDLQRFERHVRTLAPGELEELFTRTFDNTTSRALEVGWHAYGETYDRGAFLVTMRENLRALGVPENGELPDHLTHVLAALGRTCGDDKKKLAKLAYHTIAIVSTELAKQNNPYVSVLDAARKLVYHGVSRLDNRPVESVR